MTGILQLAKDALFQTANPNGVYVDFTMGRGRDTLFLCLLAPQGRVFAFDVQTEALDATGALLKEHGVTNAQLILDGHEHFGKYVQVPIDGGLFNLGFLPGGDKSRTTRCDTTLCAVKSAMASLKPGGILGIAVYPGHPEGTHEGDALQDYFSSIGKQEFDVFLYRLLNVPDAPYMMVVERRL